MNRAPSGRAEDPTVAALRAFVAQPVPPLSAADANALRDRVVSRMEAQRTAAVASAARRRVWGVFAAAACLPLVIWAATRTAGGGLRRAGSATVTDLAGRADIGGDEVTTGPLAEARAALPTGAVVDVGGSSRVRFVAPAEPGDERIELATGRIQVSVPKLAGGRDLRVRTPNATVIVHGTRFSVAAATGETRVVVTEGVVEVDGPSGPKFLTAGMSLVVSDALPVTAPPVPPLAPGPPPSSSASPGARPASTLAAENALLAEAMRLFHEGHDDRALARLDDLVARYPASPLVETARFERLRILEATGPHDRLAREAQAYLADYPRGFGRAEASRALAGAAAPEP